MESRPVWWAHYCATLTLIALGSSCLAIGPAQAREAPGAAAPRVHPQIWPRQQSPLPRDADLERRLDVLLARMTPEQKVGLPRGKVDKLEAAPGTVPEPPLAAFKAGIRSVSMDAGQRQVFVLDNDQVWRQAERKLDFSVRPGDTVQISRGALGAFFLSANPHSATRVSRVR